MDNTEWLNSLKAGDEVYASARYGNLGEVRIVSRTTATQIIFESENVVGTKYETRFRRKDGHSVGTDSWNGTHIAPLTPERRERIRRANLLATVKALPWGTYSTSKLERIFAIAGEPNV